MIGWSRRNEEGRRRRARWLASLTRREREEESRYQAYVGRRWAWMSPLFLLSTLAGVRLIGELGVQTEVLGFFAMLAMPLSLVGPFLFIKTKRRWREGRASVSPGP